MMKNRAGGGVKEKTLMVKDTEGEVDQPGNEA
jgi:hypothetical protein